MYANQELPELSLIRECAPEGAEPSDVYGN